ncbi:MAG: hypothetical protein RL334_133, partial [Chloroflexota bacterium]
MIAALAARSAKLAVVATTASPDGAQRAL